MWLQETIIPRVSMVQKKMLLCIFNSNKKYQESYINSIHSTLTCFVSLFHWVQSLPSSLSISRLGIYVSKRKKQLTCFVSHSLSVVSVKCFTVCQFAPTQQRRTLFYFRQCKILQRRLSMGHGILFEQQAKWKELPLLATSCPMDQTEVSEAEMVIECLNSDYSLAHVYLHSKFIARAD